MLKAFVDGFAYLLILLSIYWGTLFALFSFLNFLRGSTFADVFQLVFTALGLMAWVNGIYYVKRVRKDGAIKLWKDFYNKKPSVVNWTAGLTLAFLIILFLAQQSIINNQQFLSVFRWLLLPWIFGEFILTVIRTNTRDIAYLPSFDQIGWLLSLTFEVIFFYYIAKLITWRPRVKRKE
ncbi:hypothetical protein IH979_01030 [Patescibacteria group bacterium]|nr:hypothetical protein [Patescibacteria group bacterium]